MTDLTTGQRIAQCRKALALSQEGLGEKVGVSRQAISKWEADAAMPDIDKLIALSKLFQVSVGWLLGVEDLPQPQPESPQITEELLHKIEDVVQRYQPKRRKLPLWGKALIALSAVLLLWGGIRLGQEWNYLQHQVAELSGQIQRNGNSNIISKLNALEDRIDSINNTIERESATLAGYEFQIKPNPSEEAAFVYLNAVPKTWSESWSATLSIRYDGSQTMSQTCAWDGSALVAGVKLNLLNGYQYWLVIEYPDGTQEQVQLFHTAAEYLKSSFSIECHISLGEGLFNRKNGTLMLDGYVIYLTPPSLTAEQDIGWRADLVLYHIRDGQRQIADSEVLVDTETFSEEGIQILESTSYPSGPFQLPELEDGDCLELWVIAEMDNGISLVQMVSGWVYQDGDFVSGVPLE